MRTRSLLSTSLFFTLALWLFLPDAARAATFTISPTTVSNTYSGFITLTVAGLNTGQSVVVQKYVDLNTNGVVDASDYMLQQFTMADGQASVIGGVTNINVPGDTDAAAGQITAQLNFRNGDFSQDIVGKYLYKLSRSTGPVATNTLTVTNAAYAQKITGNVVNSGSNVPNAVVLFFVPKPGGGLGNPTASTVANNSGAYSIALPAGTYLPIAVKSNYLAIGSAAAVVLGSGATVNTNVTVTNATVSISARWVDAVSTTTGLPGLFQSAQANGVIGIAFTDTNGFATLRVRSGVWKMGNSDSALIVHGYVGHDGSTNIDTTGGSVANVVFPINKATALFHGSVKDTLLNPLPGVDCFAQDIGMNNYSVDGYSDPNGNYVVGVLGGLGSGDPWSVSTDGSSSNPTNYVFSMSQSEENGGTNIGAGVAVLENFTALATTGKVSGHVQTTDGTPIGPVQMNASATINGHDYHTQGNTDANGDYSMNVANGNWVVNVSCNGGDQTLDDILGAGNYICPDNQNFTIAGNNQVINFVVQPCGGVQVGTTSLPGGTNGTYYDQVLTASSCVGNFTWSLDSGSLPDGLDLDTDGEIFGTPTANGTFNFTVHVMDSNNGSTNQALSIHIAGVVTPLSVTTTGVPNGTNGLAYNAALAATGGTVPYHWSISPFSAALPGNLVLNTNGTITGAPTNSGTFYFYARVTDGTATTADSDLIQLSIVNQPLAITNTGLPNGSVGGNYNGHLGATGGQPPYTWSLATGSANLPSNLNLASDGSITGVPATGGNYNFIVQVQDAAFAQKTKPLAILVNAGLTLSQPQWLTNRFQMRITGTAGQNYTVQMSTNVSASNWVSLYVTNSASTNSFIVADPSATGKGQSYRVLVGP